MIRSLKLGIPVVLVHRGVRIVLLNDVSSN